MKVTKTEGNKKFERRVAPSKAPRRLLKKKLRDLERLIKNKNSLKDLPEEVVQETEKKMADVKKQIEALGPEEPAAAQTSTNEDGSSKSKGLKFTELRRAGRRISAFKRQHPNYETSEEESKAMEDLELDLLYIKHFPRDEEYISIYPESPLEDEAQIKTQTEIRERIAKARASGELKKPSGSSEGSVAEEAPKAVTGKHPVSNWSDESDESDDEEGEEDTKHGQARRTG
ncbi:hypothetical protein BGZ80_009756 [Entomortierella chlamydospora]|uniref:rRNA-processing protein EFG1 n=1 Tax=Entomortierella chlamydospora TaxID=101097 RepID=A0A9P6MWR3_9FUNG|nr:hypothetical protein BGZ80_009756 [Entomortierella chlamydospora]